MSPSEKLFKEILDGEIKCMVYTDLEGNNKDILERIKEELNTFLSMGYKLNELGMFCDDKLYQEILPMSMYK